MQIQVLEGNPDVYNSLLYPDQTYSSKQFLHDQFNQFSTSLTAAGQQFMTGARDLYDRISNSTAVRTAKAMLRQTGAFFNPNMIVAVDNLEGLQQANVGMQRWIMAEPTIRELYHKQLVDGYADTYVDVHPNDIGETHYDYRRVMDGILREGTSDDGYDWETVQYIDDIIEGDRELSISEKADILTTWEIVNIYAMARKEDPTNPFGGEIG